MVESPSRASDESLVPAISLGCRLARLMKSVDVTRVADITRLDTIGIPVFTAVRPGGEEGSLCVHSGKGLTRLEAWTGACMEALEYHWAEGRRHQHRLIYVSLKDARHRNEFIDPISLIPSTRSSFVLDAPYAWTSAYNLSKQTTGFLPAEVVFHPLKNQQHYYFGTESRGLAASAKLNDAILHALCEVIEHDARGIFSATRRAPNIDVTTLDDPIVCGILESFKRAGLDVTLYNLTTDLAIPVIGCTIVDPGSDSPSFINNGSGCHLDKYIALRRALLEAAQSRLGFIHGARNDLDERCELLQSRLGTSAQKFRANINHLFESPCGVISWNQVPYCDCQSSKDGISCIRTRLAEFNYDDVHVVKLTPRGYPIRVVRVVVPWLQPLTYRSFRFGPRLVQALRRIRGS